MNAERHRAAKVHFLAVRSLVAGERTAYLAHLAVEDPELAEEVASLLAHAAGEAPADRASERTAQRNSSLDETLPEHDDPTEQTPGEPARERRAELAEALPGRVRSRRSGATSRPSDDDDRAERFAAGAIFAGRYRIVAELGRGGMGRVYRAEDLVLDQTVALKLVADRRPALVGRLVDEVRLARRITHRHVCRVYDFGEAEGETFLTMEYVDGENLRSLLARIGRLTPEKFAELAQQLCSGLAAAHAEGILHRDLKPANVMIDGRGDLKIADFGLATLGAQSDRALLGTPAYVAPEQWRAGEVSVASDLWSLGLILHEMASGAPVFDAHSLAELEVQMAVTSPPLSPLLATLDPRIAAMVRQCLAADPADRPASAAAVAAALPGGDRFERALAAGETPSPEAIAEARRPPVPRRSVLWPAASFAVLLAAVVGVADRALPARRAWRDVAPALLVERAAEVLADLGHSTDPVDRAWGFQVDPLSQESEQLAFWYRQAEDWMRPGDLEQQGVAMQVAYYDPAPIEPGMVQMLFAADGRLLALKVPPADFGGDTRLASGEGEAANWDRLLAVTTRGAVAVPTEAEVVPPFFADERRAWLFPSGVAAGGSEGADGADRNRGAEERAGAAAEVVDATAVTTLRLEAAALAGRIVFADVRPQTAGDDADSPWRFGDLLDWLYSTDALLWALAAPASLWLARRNLELSRIDVVGARRLALVVVGVELSRWLLGSDHLPSPQDELLRLGFAAGSALGAGVLAWLAYVAVEPLARRFWPLSLLGWGRLLRGRLRDPEVGRSLVVGAAAGAGLTLLALADRLLVRALGLVAEPDFLVATQLELALSARRWLAGSLGALVDALFWAVLGIFLLALLRRLVDRPRVAIAAWVLLLAAYSMTGGAHPAVSWATAGLAGAAIGAVALLRGGLLAYAAALAVEGLLLDSPVTMHLGAWFAEAGVFALVTAVSVAGLGVWVAVTPATVPADRQDRTPSP